MADRTSPVEGVGEIERRDRRKAQWDLANMQAQADLAVLPHPAQHSKAIDTISASQAPLSLEISSAPTSQSDVAQPGMLSYDTLVNLSKSVWSYLFSAFSLGSSYLSNTDTAQPIGIPALDAPQEIDIQALDKFLQEMMEILHQIKKASQDTAEESKEDERAAQLRLKESLEVWLKRALEMQKSIKAEGVERDSGKFIFNRKDHKKLNEEFGTLRDQQIASAKRLQFWGNIHTGCNVAVAATVAASVGMAIFSAGTSTAALGAAMVVARPATAMASALTGFVKAHLSWQTNAVIGDLEVLKQRRITVAFQIKDSLALMTKGHEEMCSIMEMLKRLEEGKYKTARYMIS